VRLRALVPLALVASALAASPARADEAARKACGASFEKAQVLRKDGKLGAARAQAAACARDACPGFVRDECGKIIADVDAVQPTVVFDVRDEHGGDLADVRVDLDGTLLVDHVGGSAVAIDPGEHTLRFTRPGSEPHEERVIVRITEKNRLLHVTLHSAAPAPSPAAAAPPPPPPATTTVRVRGPLWPGILTATLGVAATAVSIGLGADAQGTVDSLRRTCAPACAHSDVDAVRTELVVSDVLLVAGLATVGVGVVLLVARPGGHEGARATLSVGPTVGGVRGAFTLAF
jgi:hypothetical protein